MCETRGYKSIALPAMSTGIKGYPKELSAKCIFESAQKFFQSRGTNTRLKTVKVIM